jgi:hypothetical protein
MIMTYKNFSTDIPLGVECAWPAGFELRTGTSRPHRLRLAEAWRRLMAALQPKLRSNWSR